MYPGWNKEILQENFATKSNFEIIFGKYFGDDMSAGSNLKCITIFFAKCFFNIARFFGGGEIGVNTN